MKAAHLTTVDVSLRYLILPQLEAMHAAGWDSIGISAPGPYVADIETRGIRHIALPSSTRGVNPIADIRAARQLWQILRREKLDVLHTHNPKPGLYGRVLGRLSGVPIVVNTVHGLYATPDDPWVKRAVVYSLEAVAARFSDAELVQSAEDVALLTRTRITRKSRTTHLGNGVDLARFDPARFSAADRAALRSDMGAGDGDVVVGMVGRLVAEKGYPELFEAAAQLGESYKMICIGPHDPDKSDALPEDMLEQSKRRGVRFLGMRSDVDALYQAMDIFVLPSHREGFPRSAMEAAAMGLPVVATDIRGCREAVAHGENGLLVPVADPAALTAAIRRLGDDPDERRRMGQAGKKRAQEEFDERRIVATVLDTYRAVSARKGLSFFATSFEDIEIRVCHPADASALARLHTQAIDFGLSNLGKRFMRRFYRALIGFDDSVVLAADDGTGVVGFVAGVGDRGRFYRSFLLRHGVQAGLGALSRLMRPSVLRTTWQARRFRSGGDPTIRAELLAIALRPDARGRGLGTRLGSALLEELRRHGADQVGVVVGAGNAPAIAAFRKMGFGPVDQPDVEPGAETALVLLVA